MGMFPSFIPEVTKPTTTVASYYYTTTLPPPTTSNSSVRDVVFYSRCLTFVLLTIRVRNFTFVTQN